jgi:hypothetical protein
MIPEHKQAKKLRSIFESAFKSLASVTLDITAYIPTRDISWNELDISELTFGEDYELDEVFRWEDSKGEHEMTYGDKERYKEEMEDALADIDEDSAVAYNELEDDIHKVSNAEGEYPEILWNTIWVEDGHVNQENLALCNGLAYGRLISGGHDGDEFIGLCTVGMNMSPTIAAYQILTYGGCEECYLHEFRDLSYFEYACGSAAFKAICDRLSIPKEVVKYSLAKEKERMKIFDQQMKKCSKLMKTDPVLGGLAALSLAAKVLAK